MRKEKHEGVCYIKILENANIQPRESIGDMLFLLMFSYAYGELHNRFVLLEIEGKSNLSSKPQQETPTKSDHKLHQKNLT